MWDDKSLLNVDFSLICSAYSLKDINTIERQFLELIQYNVSITASLYASYYFELRTLCERDERSFTLKPLSEEQLKGIGVCRSTDMLPFQAYSCVWAQCCLAVLRAQEKTDEFKAKSRKWVSVGDPTSRPA